MKKDRCMCVMQIIQRSFNFLKSYRFFGAPLNRVPQFLVGKRVSSSADDDQRLHFWKRTSF